MKKLFKWIKSVFSNQEKILATAIKISEAVLTVSKSPITDIALTGVKALISGTADDILIDKAHSYIDNEFPKQIMKMQLIDDSLKGKDDAEKLKMILERLGASDSSVQDSYAHDTAAKAAMFLSDDNISWSEAVILVEDYYNNQKNK